MPKKTLEARFHLFQMGHWHELLDASIHNAAKIHQRSVRRRRREAGNGIEKRASNAHGKHSTELLLLRGR